MARLSDLPLIWRSPGPWGLTRRVWRELGEDNLFTWAAATAYAWLFAIFPFLVFLVSLLPYLPQNAKDAGKAELIGIVRDSVPQQYQQSAISNIDDLLGRPRTGLLSIGLIITLWGASGGMNVTISALEKCYEIEHGRSFYKKRSIAIVLTAVVAMLLIALMALLPLGTILIRWAESNSSGYVGRPLWWTWRIARYPVALAVMFTVINTLYHYGPSIRQRYQFITPGAVFCVAVWTLLGLAFRLYVDKYAVHNETFRALGGVAILLLFFYFDAVVLLVGAEINSEIDFEVLRVPRGSRDFTRPSVPEADVPPEHITANTETMEHL